MVAPDAAEVAEQKQPWPLTSSARFGQPDRCDEEKDSRADSVRRLAETEGFIKFWEIKPVMCSRASNVSRTRNDFQSPQLHAALQGSSMSR